MREKKTVRGNTDEQEKNRKLSEAEQRRLRDFEALSETMLSQGWRRKELTVSIVKANIFAVALLIPLLILGFGLLLLLNRDWGQSLTGIHPLLFLVLLFALIVVHELIHGLSWSIFTAPAGCLWRRGSISSAH